MTQAIRWTLLAVITPLILSAGVGAATYAPYALDGVPIPGFANSINNSGVITGNLTNSDISVFTWSKGDGTVDIGQYELSIGVNEAGQIAGTHMDYETGRVNPRIRYSDGTIVDYGLPNGAFGAFAEAMNDKGEIGSGVDYRDGNNDLLYQEAIIYDADGNITPISLPHSILAGVACLNNVGYAIAYSAETTVQPQFTYYVWKAGSNLVPLESLRGANDTRAYAMNDSGETVGISGGHAVWWDLSGHIHDLGVGVALSINSRGQIVGDSDNSAVLWDTDGSSSVLPALNGDCSHATDINDNGWIVGYIGHNNVGAEAVLWQPVPEPSCLLALAGGLGCMMATRRRRKR